jgi:queuine tRNA-ribosyltransferase
MVLANTYHLHLQPGEAVVAEAGGLHRFMGWSGPLLTDSGGFQVFSLGGINTIDDQGVVFRSPRTGPASRSRPSGRWRSRWPWGPMWRMAFDQCPYPASEADVAAACRRTHGWLERCIHRHNRPDQALFRHRPGGLLPPSARRIGPGGGCNGPAWHRRGRRERGGTGGGDAPNRAPGGPVTARGQTPLPDGVGSLREMAIAVAEGFDLFDCVLPTRLGRHGTALVNGERWNLRNARFRHDHTPSIPAACARPAGTTAGPTCTT